jgi:hypothetical protein
MPELETGVNRHVPSYPAVLTFLSLVNILNLTAAQMFSAVLSNVNLKSKRQLDILIATFSHA